MSTLAHDLLIRPRPLEGKTGERISITPEAVGFEYLSFSVRAFTAGETVSGQTGRDELGIVILGGRFTVHSSVGSWSHIGARAHVFDGLPTALYLPIGTSYTVMAETDGELAFCRARAEKAFPARLISPEDVQIEIRGGGNATRQINHILTPDFPADRLMIVEVYTPSGNWSSYPPHKHDVHNPPEEVDLEEIYYYKVDRPEGYAIQRIYTADGRRDVTLTVRDGDLVLIPEGYHPVVAAHGYNVYYLNALAGSARSMAASDDPTHAWVRTTWTEKDPRVPLVR
ncbi:MAG: 5-deoxy-glucuronate isomerase [Blastocatellia bacterium]|nr:5-deoxy-glucuronate isomerase [Blastocatellia bacterium]MCS7156341.1 5-deoxy-glucuronate isomerase [Blastocatellia bacterium]MCX7751308.1 5-deoxy-glucuronate isomerase [Blastocatellia bacterium]MDW8169021.1 5-deoxy-glucuronate isomerase [Acidobacteriota bacterium]MDW8256381.1 5-deoxy-glucuronate isomerase [Acidobacteriota bacterium]